MTKHAILFRKAHLSLEAIFIVMTSLRAGMTTREAIFIAMTIREVIFLPMTRPAADFGATHPTPRRFANRSYRVHWWFLRDWIGRMGTGNWQTCAESPHPGRQQGTPLRTSCQWVVRPRRISDLA